MLKKAKDSGRDPYLSLLDWRNTPSEGFGYSPAQRLLCRRTRTLIPTAKSLLKPAIPRGIDRKLLVQKSKQAYYYEGAKELPELKEGDVVRIKPLKPTEKRKPWTRASVEGKVDIRSYKVRTEDGRLFRRNRKHLRRSTEQPEESTTTSEVQLPAVDQQPEASTTSSSTQCPKIEPVVTQQPAASPKTGAKDIPTGSLTTVRTTPVKSDGQQRTRSGRVVRKPNRYQDFTT